MITTLTADGQRVAQATVPNDRPVLLQYFARFPGPHRAVVEATGRWYWLRDLLVPADTGGRQRHKTSRDGNRYLKLAFSHAAIRAVQYFPEVRQWYQRWKRKKPLRVARALVAKELAQSVYVVLRENVEFNQQFKGTPLTKRKQASWPRRASPSA